MPRNESFFLRGPAGALESLLMLPDGPPVGVGLVCHAHPLHGGMMHFKLVFRAAKVLQEAGYACLRFNFRGVGLSEGRHDQGEGEQDDVRAGLTELRVRFPGLPLVLGGFSFGAWVSLRAGVDEGGIGALFALGFPYRSLPDTGFLGRVRAPLLIVQGENDTFGPGGGLSGLGLPETAQVVIVPGADHFFSGHEGPVFEALQQFIGTLPHR